ncbi:MAG: hypothetical protein M0R34_03220 [Candidatus Marinimicrobia bacterium]|jgi:hypothetical protein|nr:hypothetical protein [Candidatus Neomarinimicrobiota bacterium]MCK9483356.1 hypothetical protein [Candidatus Neomarinimicrobiota bacterium]MCK9560286.1 hypothetical protein [Candidatus Neomarinimicrobiota bacterium]MDD5061856.1 hypothetical protein [Candidatus Neomarinimicrobiota bacterium]MDD5230755.1 hypothetical protein [Candidatus Neomarinimicrobiota bacterium]
MNITNLSLLEEKIKSLLAVVTQLREENHKMKTELKEGASLEVMLDLKKRQELRSKIEGMLELLKDY